MRGREISGDPVGADDPFAPGPPPPPGPLINYSFSSKVCGVTSSLVRFVYELIRFFSSKLQLRPT